MRLAVVAVLAVAIAGVSHSAVGQFVLNSVTCLNQDFAPAINPSGQFTTGPCPTNTDEECASNCCFSGKCRAALSLTPGTQFCQTGYSPNFDGPDGPCTDEVDALLTRIDGEDPGDVVDDNNDNDGDNNDNDGDNDDDVVDEDDDVVDDDDDVVDADEVDEGDANDDGNESDGNDVVDVDDDGVSAGIVVFAVVAAVGVVGAGLVQYNKKQTIANAQSSEFAAPNF